LKVYTYTNDERYKTAAVKALDYLLSKEARPMGATFWCRKNPNKDFCNGTVGQAFTIDALTYAYEVLGCEKAKAVAEEVFLLHPFYEELGLWRRVAVDGSYLSVDLTLNHQLYFAIAGLQLGKIGNNAEVIRRVEVFVKNLEKNIEIREFFCKGMLYDIILRATVFTKRKINLFKLIRLLKIMFLQKKSKKIRDSGYHQYNMWLFFMLNNLTPEADFWKTKKFKAILGFNKSKHYEKMREVYGIVKPNGVKKFENTRLYEAYTILAFCDMENKEQIVEELLSAHFEQEYDPETNMVNKFAADKLTQAARIYEAIRLPNFELTLKNIDFTDEK
jgi:hypothetical protein